MNFKPQVEQIPYADAAADFSRFSGRAGAFFLDSSLRNETHGRFSYWGIDPLFLYHYKEGFVSVGGQQQISTPADSLQSLYSKIADLPDDPYLPFSCGLVGFLGYEWGASLENVAPAAPDDLQLPEAFFGFHDTIVIYDHLEESCRIVSYGLGENGKIDRDKAVKKTALLGESIRKNRGADKQVPAPVTPFSEPASSMTDGDYTAAYEQIQKYLLAGDCYQINLTQRFTTPMTEKPWAVYENLRRISPASYSAFIHGGDFQILSSSPELFLEADRDGHLKTEPIKGTRRRGTTPEEDAKLKTELAGSAKDRAELLMITDLERNDLGKIARPGSVRVATLEKIATLNQAHHLHSVVEADRDPRRNIADVLKAMMPGGSITGAPKIRAMQIIGELEKNRRDIYTGAIGWIGPQNTCQMNVAIRTIVVKNDHAHFYAGGGITVDSDCAAEKEELLVKAAGMRQALRG